MELSVLEFGWVRTVRVVRLVFFLGGDGGMDRAGRWVCIRRITVRASFIMVHWREKKNKIAKRIRSRPMLIAPTSSTRSRAHDEGVTDASGSDVHNDAQEWATNRPWSWSHAVYHNADATSVHDG